MGSVLCASGAALMAGQHDRRECYLGDHKGHQHGVGYFASDKHRILNIVSV